MKHPIPNLANPSPLARAIREKREAAVAGAYTREPIPFQNGMSGAPIEEENMALQRAAISDFVRTEKLGERTEVTVGFRMSFEDAKAEAFLDAIFDKAECAEIERQMG